MTIINYKELNKRMDFLKEKIKRQRELREEWKKEKEEIRMRKVQIDQIFREKGITKEIADKF